MTRQAIRNQSPDAPALRSDPSPSHSPDAPSPPSGAAPPAPSEIIVAAGIDTLVIGYEIDSWRDPATHERLETAKQEASASQFVLNGYPLDWCGWRVDMMPRGARGYEWQFYNADVAVRMAKKAENGRRFPEVYVTLRATFLWREGWVKAAQMVRDWVSLWAVVGMEKVSRADLAVDVATDFPALNIRRDLVTRGRTRAEWQTAGEIVGYSRGVRPTSYRVGSGDLLARVYDKTDEVKVKHHEWWHEVWRVNGWDGETGVTRTEFQVRRGMLKEYEVNTIEELGKRLADMWRYFTDDWLRLVTWQRRGQHERWRVLPLWKAVQDAVIGFGTCYGMLRFKQKQAEYERVWRQARGCMVTMGALVGSVTSTPEGIFKIREKLRAMLDDEDFRADIAKRAYKLAVAGPAQDWLVNEAVRARATVSGSSF